MMEQTKYHFEHLGLPKDANIFFDAQDKGPRLRGILEVWPRLRKSKIIFVDDLDPKLN